jgi:sugar phosphate isomerase/epimerase
MKTISRRSFMTRGLAGLAACGLLGNASQALALGETKRLPGARIKLALNASSFNAPLRAGRMKLEEVIDYCATVGLDALDPTGYYFPGYPAVPSDEYIASIKRRAFVNGVTLNCTGVRNDFARVDAEARKGDIQLIKNWIDVTAKLGAGAVRIFSGNRIPEGHTFGQVLTWMIPAFQECAEYGKNRGVIVALQHHDDFLKTADETIQVVQAVNSEWFSLVLDVGSLRQGDPYAEIEKLVPYACTWQIKENVYRNGKAEPIDIPKIKAIIDKVGYRGFVPIECLQGGGSAPAITAFLAKVREGMGVA